MDEADALGFEPRDPCGSPVFKTGVIDHSTKRPKKGMELPYPTLVISCNI